MNAPLHSWLIDLRRHLHTYNAPEASAACRRLLRDIEEGARLRGDDGPAPSRGAPLVMGVAPRAYWTVRGRAIDIDDVAAAKAWRLAGWSHARIAGALGVPPRDVTEILRINTGGR